MDEPNTSVLYHEVMNLFAWLRPGQDRNPRTADVAVTIAVTGFIIAGMFIDGADDDRKIDLLAWALMVPSGLVTFFRRTAPIPALALATVLGFTYWILDYPEGGDGLPILVMLYSAAAHIDDRRISTRVLMIFTTALLLVLVMGYFWEGEEEVTIWLIVVNLIGFQIAWLVGDSVRQRRQQLTELELQVLAAEQTTADETQRALELERTRIARELHDTVAHSMSVVIVQAEGAQRVLDTNPESARDALAVIADVARRNLSDIRETVTVLRSNPDEDADLAPTPSLADASELIEQCRQSGLDVSMSVDGDRRELPTMVELSGYRILQESLTNTMKHGGPDATAEVTISYEPDSVSIEVHDDGRGAAAQPSAEANSADRASIGHGIIGMRERVELFGGELSAGPLPGGGFGVRANIPARQP